MQEAKEMNDYIEQLTARQVIEMIANEWVELSHDKVRIQRDDHIRWCKKWLETHPEGSSWQERKEIAE
jgi:hypothetical protein